MKREREMVGPARPSFVLFGSSIVQLSYSNGGWGAILSDIYARKVCILVDFVFNAYVSIVCSCSLHTHTHILLVLDFFFEVEFWRLIVSNLFVVWFLVSLYVYVSSYSNSMCSDSPILALNKFIVAWFSGDCFRFLTMWGLKWHLGYEWWENWSSEIEFLCFGFAHWDRIRVK